MKPGDRNEVPTVSEVVDGAVAITDPDGADIAVQALYDGFEDDDRPATAAEDLGGELAETLNAIDPDGDSAAAQMTVASAVWLATNIEQRHRREHVLREAARLRFAGDPPEPVAAWLAEQGVDGAGR
jgi:hypothetical protein